METMRARSELTDEVECIDPLGRQRGDWRRPSGHQVASANCPGISY